MSNIERARNISFFLISSFKKTSKKVKENIRINTDLPNEAFIISIFIDNEKERVEFKKTNGSSYVTIENGRILERKDEDELAEIFNIFELVGEKIIGRILQKEKKPKIRRENLTRMQKIDRLLDRYNDYQKLYESFGDERHLKKKERLINLMKSMKKNATK